MWGLGGFTGAYGFAWGEMCGLCVDRGHLTLGPFLQERDGPRSQSLTWVHVCSMWRAGGGS